MNAQHTGPLAGIIRAFVVCLCLAASTLLGAPDVAKASSVTEIPIPEGIELDGQLTTEQILSAFLGIAYRPNGVVDDEGRYVDFNQPDVVLDTPGLNCSGYVLAVCRFLFKRNIPLSEVAVDRLGDSGPDSPLGHDWDFGWDLVLNLTDGMERTFLLPGYETISPEETTGESPRGFDLHTSETWVELKERLRPGYVYLLSFNRDTAKKGYKIMHYHVGILHVDGAGRLLMYQATTQARKSYMRDLSSSKGLSDFLRNFANTGNVRKHIMVLEVKLP